MSSFYSTIAAYEHIFANEKLAAQRAILSRCNLNNYIEANIVYDKEKSDAEKNDLLSSIPLASGMVMSGQKSSTVEKSSTTTLAVCSTLSIRR